MSTPDQPATPPLTRRQLREIRNTGATPIVIPGTGAFAAPPAAEPDAAKPEVVESEAAQPEAEPEAAQPEAAQPEAAQPEAAQPEAAQPEAAQFEAERPEAVESEASHPEAEKLEGESEVADPADVEPADSETRDTDEEAAEYEVVPADVSDEPVEPADSPSADHDDESDRSEAPTQDASPAVVDAGQIPGSSDLASGAHGDLGVSRLTRRQAREQERIRTASVPIIAPDLAPAPAAVPAADAGEPPIVTAGEVRKDPAPTAPDDVATPEAGSAPEERDDAAERPVALVNPHFGSGLLAGENPVVELPPSFDQLIARNASTTGSSSTPNALILSQTPSAAPLVAPVTATGEVLITGSFDLPEGLGSVGHAPGVHDGKDVDAVLVDGELPAASSPTPIAASSAVSTVRNNDEIIRPPAPEKGSRLVLALAITAGALLLTVVGLIGLAIATGAL